MIPIASVSPSSVSDYGPWCFITSNSEIYILQGSVFYTDEMNRLPIEGLNTAISIGSAKYILLNVKIEGGYPKSASLKASESLEPYRTFKDNQKTIQTQTSLSVPVYVIGGGPGGYFDDSTGKTIQKCLNTDLMIYANCDGLVFLPAPFSIPPWENVSPPSSGGE